MAPVKFRGFRRRVAVLIDAIEDDCQAGILRGAAQTAAAAHVELVCIAGGVLGDGTDDPRALRNFVFDVFDPNSVDGVLVLSSALGSRVGMEALASWERRFRGVPLVNLGTRVPIAHSISIDGASGMRAMIAHLIEGHHHRRIAFVRGPTTSHDAEERHDAYRAALAQHGIEYDPNLVVPGTGQRESGTAAVRELFERRGVNVKTLQAIVCANDPMALGALDALRERGIAVPTDVALVGFDDLDATRSVVPPLTTVRPPTEELGREGLRRVIALMNESEEPSWRELAAEAIVRRSCGCARIEALGRARPSPVGAMSLEAALQARRMLIGAELARSAHGAFFAAGAGWEERLLTALSSDVAGKESSALVGTIDQLMNRLKHAGTDLTVFQTVISVLRREVWDAGSADVAGLSRADDVLDAARELVGEWLLREEIARRVATVEHLREFSLIASLLVGSAPLEALRPTFEQRCRALGIPALSLGLFQTPGEVSDRCTCIVAYGEDRQFDVPLAFRTSYFGPPEVFRGINEPLLVQPLLFEGEPLGIMSIVLGVLSPAIYQQMAEILSAGLKAFRAAEQLRALDGTGT